MRWFLIFGIIALNLYFVSAITINITGWDIFSQGDSGAGELAVGGGAPSNPRGIPPSAAPSAPSAPIISADAGGGAPFKLDKSFFALEVKKGLNYQEKINITNTGSSNLTISISVNLSRQFVFPEEESFVLNSKESREINFDIYVPESEINDAYIGKIIFSSSVGNKTVNFVLEVGDQEPLFDIKTTLLKKYIFPGGDVKADVFILNLGDLRNIDVELEYFIRDFNNNTYTAKKETFALNESFDGEIFLEAPADLKVGSYLLYSKVSYGQISANSYDTFFIEKLSLVLWMIILFINIGLIVLVGIKMKHAINEKNIVKKAQ